MTEYVARNGDERYAFDGVELGYADTDDGGSLRWTEITIWRTKAGKYVVEKIGRSVVFHALNGCDYGVVRYADGLDTDSRPCPICNPSSDGGPTGEVKIETDRYSTAITETASAAVEACRITDNDPDSDGYGTVFMPNVARRALTEAAAKDVGIRDAYLTQRIA